MKQLKRFHLKWELKCFDHLVSRIKTMVQKLGLLYHRKRKRTMILKSCFLIGPESKAKKDKNSQQYISIKLQIRNEVYYLGDR